MHRNCSMGMLFMVFVLSLALGRGETQPVLALEVSQITLSKRIPKEGDKVMVVATVANGSQANLDKVQMEFFVTNPEGRKASLGNPQTVAELKAGESQEVQAEWNPAVNGMYSIQVVARAGTEKAEASLEAPVTARDLYFVWVAVYYSVEDCAKQGLRWANVARMSDSGGPNFGYAVGHLSAWSTGTGFSTAEQYANFLARSVEGDEPKVFLLDEIPGETTNPDNIGVQGLIQFIKAHPDVLCFLWMGVVPEQVKFLPKEPNMLLMPEIYLGLARAQRKEWGDGGYGFLEYTLDLFKSGGWLSQTIPSLYTGYVDPRFDTTPADLEKQIRICKTKAPECPGVSFFLDMRLSIPGMNRFADSLCYKYYIRPVLALYPEDVQVSSSGTGGVKIEATVRNVGGMDARNVRLRFYAKLAGGPKKAIGKKVIAVVPAMRKVPDPLDGSYKVAFSWKPNQPGEYEVWVEIVPQSDATMLEGAVKKSTSVK